ncbi:MAG: hypothetical protein AB8G17_20220 [Gammaproteobacteria bacterium]
MYFYSAKAHLAVSLILAPTLSYAAPANDFFAFPETISQGTWSGSNVDATAEPGEPQHANVPVGASVWYQWSAPGDGYLTVDTVGSLFDTVLGLYTGNSVDALTVIAANDDAVGRQSRLLNIPVSSNVCMAKYNFTASTR